MEFDHMLSYSPQRSAGGRASIEEAWDRLSVQSRTSSTDSQSNTHVLFSQRSIGTTARNDLQRMAAMANMAGVGGPAGMQTAAAPWAGHKGPVMMSHMGMMSTASQMPYLGQSTGGYPPSSHQAMPQHPPPGLAQAAPPVDFDNGLRMPESAMQHDDMSGFFTGLDEQTLAVLQQLVGGPGPMSFAQAPPHQPSSHPSTPMAPPCTPSAYQLPNMSNLPNIRTTQDPRQHMPPPQQHFGHPGAYNGQQQPHQQHSYPHNTNRGAYGYTRPPVPYQSQARMRAPPAPAAPGYHAQPNTPHTATARNQEPAAAAQPDLLVQLLQNLIGSSNNSPAGSPTAAQQQTNAFNRLLAAGNAGMDANSLITALQGLMAGHKPEPINIPDAAFTPNVTPTHAGAPAAHMPPPASRLGRHRLSSTDHPCAPAPTPTAGNIDAQQMLPASPGKPQRELASGKAQLVQLMTSAAAFIGSETVTAFFDKLSRVAEVYDGMHVLPVVQKRRACEEQGRLRQQLMADSAFVSILQAASALRDHIYSQSRKVLLMSASTDGVPIDLFLGSMATEMRNIVLDAGIDEQVADFFTNVLPLPKLALLVFAEFVPVDPAPVVVSLSEAASRSGSEGGEGPAVMEACK